MIIRLDDQCLQPSMLNRVAEVLCQDGVIAYPTDTVFGIGCLISSKKAVDRIQVIKGCAVDKPMSILCADFVMLSHYVNYLDDNTLALLKKMFPGPYTAVLPCSYNVPSYLQKGHTVGLRMPNNAFCRAITTLVGEPIVTTSCNISGTDPLQSAEEIFKNLGSLLDLVVDCGPVGGLASTVVQLSPNSEPIVLRHGAGPWPL